MLNQNICVLPAPEDLIQQSESSDIWQLVIAIILAYLLSYLLGKVYFKCSDTLSNRYIFSRLFPLISSATCLVIFVVKSSLALSLGLVGALSIVRFRTAIKDPEELIYLFISIAFGLAAGAEQYSAAIIGFLLISAGGFILKLRRNSVTTNNFFRLSVEGFDSSKITHLIEIISAHVDRVDINSLISSSRLRDKCAINFSISINNLRDLIELKEELSSNFSGVMFNFIEAKTI